MKNKFIILFIIFGLIMVMTYPLVIKITTHIPGFFSTDESYGSLWESWRIQYSVFNHLPVRKTLLIAYPFGADLYGTGVNSFLAFGIFYSLSIFMYSVLPFDCMATIYIPAER